MGMVLKGEPLTVAGRVRRVLPLLPEAFTVMEVLALDGFGVGSMKTVSAALYNMERQGELRRSGWVRRAGPTGHQSRFVVFARTGVVLSNGRAPAAAGPAALELGWDVGARVLERVMREFGVARGRCG